MFNSGIAIDWRRFCKFSKEALPQWKLSWAIHYTQNYLFIHLIVKFKGKAKQLPKGSIIKNCLIKTSILLILLCVYSVSEPVSCISYKGIVFYSLLIHYIGTQAENCAKLSLKKELVALMVCLICLSFSLYPNHTH